MEWLGRKSESGKSRFLGRRYPEFFKIFDSQVELGADHDSYGGLVATRFMLGLFEAGCLPLFVRLLARDSYWGGS